MYTCWHSTHVHQQTWESTNLLCCHNSLLSSTSLLLLVFTSSRQEANHNSVSPKYLSCEENMFALRSEKRQKFSASFLKVSSSSAPLSQLPCLMITSRVELSLSVTSHLSPMCVWAPLLACELTSKCVKVRTHALVSPLAANPPKVKGNISWQLPACIGCDHFHPPAALPSSLLFYLLLLSPAGLCWAHAHLNVGQRPLTQGSGCVLLSVFVSVFIRVKLEWEVERLAAFYQSYVSVFKAV